MFTIKSTYLKKFIGFSILLPLIPPRAPKKRSVQLSNKVIEPELLAPQKNDSLRTKECAICRRSEADYEHSCGVAFHKVCLQRYFDAISNVDGAERICPHCYDPVPLDLEHEEGGAVEVSPISDEVYNQYMDLVDEFSLALIEGRIMDVSVFLNSPSGENYFVNVDFGYYPRKPTFSFSDELLSNIEGLDELLEELNSWVPEFPPRLVEVLHSIESRIKSKENKAEEIIDEHSSSMEEKKIEEKNLEEKREVEFIEVSPDDEFVEFIPEKSKKSEEEVYEVDEILPATFFELIEEEDGKEEFENEEAIQQYLDLNNNFSLELVGDEIYEVIVYLSCMDSGIYNIYPTKINFRDYPKKPVMTFTDDLLVRIRDLDGILAKLKNWDSSIPRNIVDIFQELETKLAEDSVLESELELIGREYKTKRLSKNRIVVWLYTYGQRFFKLELNLKNYPSPPVILLPEDLGELKIEELDGIKKWAEKPQKRIMDVLRSLSHAVQNLYRIEFEESLLKMIADEFEIKEGKYHVVISLPKSTQDTLEDKKPLAVNINLILKVPKAYPIMPPEIEIETEDEEYKRAAQIFLSDMLKSWIPGMFLADAINRLSLSLSKTSLFTCIICGLIECPICNLPLLTTSIKDTEEVCELPCIQCKRPYHVHCLKHSVQKGTTVCGYCFTDLSKLFRNNIFNQVG